MELTERITALSQAVGVDVKSLFGAQGALADLTTSNKSNLVAAINEVLSSNTSINDNAGSGDTDVTWSADKIYNSIGSPTQAATYQQLKSIMTAGTGVYLTWDDALKKVYVGTSPQEMPGSQSIVWAQSSVYSSLQPASASNMRDGYLTTGTGTDNLPNSWIRADFGTQKTITHIGVGGSEVIGWGIVPPYLNGASLQWANSPSGPWTTDKVVADVTSQGGIKLIELSVAITARYWRLYKASEWVAVAEFRFY